MPKIMSVEDEPAIADLIKRRLVRAGFEVIQAKNGQETMEKSLVCRPDLILMDIGLGEFSPDGWEINQRLKENEATASIPVIALTAHANRVEHRDKALREGFVEHVSKPIRFEELANTITTVLASVCKEPEA